MHEFYNIVVYFFTMHRLSPYFRQHVIHLVFAFSFLLTMALIFLGNTSGGIIDQALAGDDVRSQIMHASSLELTYSIPAEPESDSPAYQQCFQRLSFTSPEYVANWQERRRRIRQDFIAALERVASNYETWNTDGRQALEPLSREFAQKYQSNLMPINAVENFSKAINSSQTPHQALEVIRLFMAHFGVKVIVTEAGFEGASYNEDVITEEIAVETWRAFGNNLIYNFAHLPKSLFADHGITLLELYSSLNHNISGEAVVNCGEQSMRLSVHDNTIPGENVTDAISNFFASNRANSATPNHELAHLIDPQKLDRTSARAAKRDYFGQLFAVRVTHNPRNISRYAETNEAEGFAEHMAAALSGHLVAPSETRLMRSGMNRQLLASLAVLEAEYPGISAHLIALGR